MLLKPAPLGRAANLTFQQVLNEIQIIDDRNTLEPRALPLGDLSLWSPFAALATDQPADH